MADEFDVSDEAEIAATGGLEAPIEQNPAITPAAAASTGEPTPEEIAAIGHELEMEAKFGDAPLEAAAIAAADTATFSLAGRLLDSLDLRTTEEQKEIRERNPGADMLGTMAGAVGPALIPGAGPLAVAARVATGPASLALKAGKVAEKMVSSAIAKSGSKNIAKGIVKKSLELGAQGATEGAAFGVGSLLREEALGEADLNAENLLAHAGTGALFGGLIGGALPVVGAGLKGAGKSAGRLFDAATEKYADPVKAFREFTGFTQTKWLKMTASDSGKEMVEDFPRWVVEDAGFNPKIDSKADLLEKISTLAETQGKNIDSILTELDGMAASRISTAAGSPNLRGQLLGRLADELETEFLVPNSEWSSLGGSTRKIQKLVNDIRFQASKPSALTGKAIVGVKRKIDQIITEQKLGRVHGRKPGVAELAAYKARGIVNKASQLYAEYVDPLMAEQLKKANRDFRYASEIMPSLEKTVDKSKDFLGFKDTIFGALAYGVMDAPGLLLLAGKKFLDSDLRRRLVIMTNVKKASDRVASHVSKSIDNFFSKTTRPSQLAAMQALLNSPLAHQHEDGKKSQAPKDKKEAYANIQKNLVDFSSEPEKLISRTVKSGAPISHVAPQTAQVVGERLITAVQFLQQKVPKSPYEAELPGMKPKPFTPSSMQMSKFERYLQAIDSPLSVLEDLESNALTREHVEAIKAVYPKLYDFIRQTAYAKMLDTEEVLPYSKKVQLSLLLNLDGDASLLGKNIAALQANFKVQEKPEGGTASVVKPTAGGAAKMGQSERTASDTTAFLKRRQE